MGIRDRDYMKRPADDDGDPRSSPAGSKVEEFLSGFLARHPRCFLYAGVGLAVLVVLALIIAKFAGAGQ